jgi:hypothetical protein
MSCRSSLICHGVKAYDRNDTMEDLFKAGYKKDDILDALRILPFVRLCTEVTLISSTPL